MCGGQCGLQLGVVVLGGRVLEEGRRGAGGELAGGE